MSTKALRARLRKLIGNRVDPEHCPGGVTVVLTQASGEAEPLVPADAYRCERCGQAHVLILEEIVVTMDAERQEPGQRAAPADGIPQV